MIKDENPDITDDQIAFSDVEGDEKSTVSSIPAIRSSSVLAR